ncbi:MAG: methyltransferase domain-containing protein [Acidimicrobiia bacterium]|nr:methyltransferase domain-containing protein [Acidimicrobiia bacterium]
MMLNPYERSAEVYDLYFSWLDYETNAITIHELIEERKPGAESMLELGCGTGRYMEQLRQWYGVEGLDVSESMLTVAHRRLPAATFHLADMTEFDLEKTYDAVVCLFSSVAYVTSLADLGSMMRCAARHLNPGGVLIIEPWFTPDAWVEGQIDARIVEGEGVKVARIGGNALEGNRAVMRWAWAVAWEDGDADAYVEEHPTGLFTLAEYDTLLREAGLTPEYDPEGPLGRGLHIAVKR